MDLALKAKSKPIASLAFVPPLVYPGEPDFALMHRKVKAKIAASEAADVKATASPKPPAATTAAPTAATPGSSSTPKPTKKSSSKTKKEKSAAATDDLSNVCSAR
jgi:hypothetical protein